jgi:hypothetical protein
MKKQISATNHSKLAGILSLLAAGFLCCAAPTAAGASPVADTMSIEAYIASLLESVSDDSTKDLRPAPPKPKPDGASKVPGARQ